MKYIMFTKHLEGLDIDQVIQTLLSVGVEGADLCVRSGYPVNPDNVTMALPAAAQSFADHNLSIPLVTTPGDFLNPEADVTVRVYEACQQAGVKKIIFPRSIPFARADPSDRATSRSDPRRPDPIGSPCLTR